MRIRTIKPEFWQSESMASASRDARLVAIALLNYADDTGVFLASERVFKGAMFPFDDDLDVLGAFQELYKNGFIAFAEHSGKVLGKILNFKIHQRIDKPQKSRFGAENAAFGSFPGAFQERSKNLPRTFAEPSVTEVEMEMEVESEKEPERKEEEDARETFPKVSGNLPEGIGKPSGDLPETFPTTGRSEASKIPSWPAGLDPRQIPDRLSFISACKVRFPRWQAKHTAALWDSWKRNGWRDGNDRPIAYWQPLVESWYRTADESEKFERLPEGQALRGMGINLDAMRLRA